MLEFNPHFRLTAAEALKSPAFDNIRISEFEKPSSKQINLGIFAPEFYNYETNECKLTVEMLKKMLYSEVKKVRKMSPFYDHINGDNQ